MATVRYIRATANGSTSNTSTHVVELQAFDDTSTNVALNKTVTGDTPNRLALSNIVDGDTNSSNYVGLNDGKRSFTVDLGQEYDILDIRLFRYSLDNRSYYEDQIEVSVDNSTWYTVGGPQTQQYAGNGAFWSITDFSAIPSSSSGSSGGNDDSYKILGFEPVYMQDFGGVEEGGAPASNTAGAQYASAYIGYTSGTIINHSTSDSTSLDAVVDSMTDGDALLLAPGTYTMTRGSVAADTFRDKEILICGDTDQAQDILVEFNHDLPAATRDHPIFSNYASMSNGNTLTRQWAFVAFKRVQTSSTNYVSALLKGSTATKGKMVNCYIDLNGGDVSWVYDNNGQTTHDVRWHNCTFANYGSWLSQYSGWTSANKVYNGLFQKTYHSSASFQGTQVTNATIDTTNRTYNTATYSSNGHLVIDANYLDYANPV